VNKQCRLLDASRSTFYDHPKPESEYNLMHIFIERLWRSLKSVMNPTLPVLGELIERFAASDLPYKVDVVDYAAASKSFQSIIDQHYEVIQQPKLEPCDEHFFRHDCR